MRKEEIKLQLRILGTEESEEKAELEKECFLSSPQSAEILTSCGS